MSVIVDTSVWIDYFRSGKNSAELDFLIDEDLVVMNDLILAELVPTLRVRGGGKVIQLLRNIKKLDMSINWEQIIEFQYKCLKSGLNRIGIPDLLVAQNSVQNRCRIYSLDNHFRLLKDILGLKLLDSN